MDITPDKQNIDRVFSNTTYHIDFYQRDYKWTDEPVRRLLQDVFYSFEESYAAYRDLDPSLETISAKYPWYYLNTYVTNMIDGRVYVVDGQQRLTTLTLILIKLHHQAKGLGSKLADWIAGKIAGQDGYTKTFWMNHERHLVTLEKLFNGDENISTNSGLTAENMLANYEVISEELDARLSDIHKLDTFVLYLMRRVVLINLAVEQTDVPMVFEVINDRGVRLRPYEILKGKLLGQIDKLELETGKYNELWEDAVGRVNYFWADEIDEFFAYFLKAKYADTRSVAQRFDGEYHREIFKNDLNSKLKLDHNPIEVKAFLNGPFRYYTSLYAKLLGYAAERSEGLDSIFFNDLNGMENQYLLILSACAVDDPEEASKIKLVSAHVDRIFALLRLQRSYDSNEFNDAVYDISRRIRERPAVEIPGVFELQIKQMLETRRGTQVTESFDYAQFKNTSINDVPMRFVRYFFARVDEYLALHTNVGVKHTIEDLVTKTGAKTGFHVEHILSYNRNNVGLYDDEEAFEVDRNRLGAVLLMKGMDNISSGNESYKQKLKSYANTLYWNETLRSDSYKSKKDMDALIRDRGIKLQPRDHFGPEEVESRQKLLYAIAADIWSTEQSGE